MVPTDAGRYLLSTHQCNAYCRDGRHAELVWFLRDATVAEYRAGFVRDFGLAVLDFVPNPEAPLPQKSYGWNSDLNRPGITHPTTQDGYTGFLVIFTTTEDTDGTH